MNMATKRTLHQDPEYDAIPAEIQEKRIKLLEVNVRKQAKKKLEAIIKSNFEQEIAKQHERVDNVDEVLHEARFMTDRFRAYCITNFYAKLVQEQGPNERASSSIHPTVKKYLSKSPRRIDCNSTDNAEDSNQDAIQGSSNECQDFQFNNNIQLNKVSSQVTNSNPSPLKREEICAHASRFRRKYKIVVGNVSKYIPIWQRDGSDQSTHKWMVYVRGDKNHPNIENFVKKVRFLLHPSYKPSDIVEISNPPFQLIKRGWGEFPVRVQLHFHDIRDKPVDIIHNLKLDKTFTGFQTLGAETAAEVLIFKPDEARVNSNNTFSFKTASQSKLISTENNTTIMCNGPTTFQSTTQKEDSNNYVHTIIKKEPDSLVMNIKLPKAVSIDGKSDQASNVNSHKVISPSNDCTQAPSSAESNSEKKTVPKIVISNNKVTTKNSPLKPITIANGLNTTFVKCKDNEGRVLLVPQSSLTFKTPSSIAKQNSIPQSNTEVVTSSSTTVENSVNKTVPSYILKLVPNQDSGQNQVFLIPLSEKKNKIASKLSSEINAESDSKKKSESVSNNSSIIKSPHLHYEQELDSIKLEYYKSFMELLRRVCTIFPLVKKGVDRSVFTFSADSIAEFHTWNIGKQRASEWRRAGMVRKAIINLLNKKGSPHINSESVWSQSSIMSWCRKNGFVPMATEKVTLLPEPKWSGVELCSLTNPNDLVSCLQEEKHTIVRNDEEEIEVVDILDEKKPDTNTVQPEACFLPHLSDSAAFVKHTASQLGIDIKPVEVEPQLYVPAIEEMMVSVCRQLACDLIGSSLNEGFNRLGGKICPEEITVSDVYSAIKSTPKFDIFSNSCLGIPKDLPENT